MRQHAILLLLVFNAAHAAPAPTDFEAQAAHARGQCGKLGPGTGLGADGKGWVVSMLPGPHEFRVLSGTVGVTVLHQTTVDLDAGRPTYIEVTDPAVIESCGPAAKKGSVCLIQWSSAGWQSGPVSRLFLYPTEARRTY